MTDHSGEPGGGAGGSAAYRWILVVALAAMVNVGYGTMFYSFGVLLGGGRPPMLLLKDGE